MTTISCADKNDGPDSDTVTASSTGPTASSVGNETTFDPYPDGVTYAGPDEDSWISTTSTGPAPDGTTTDDFPDASTYGGPDESTSTTEFSTSSTSSTETEASTSGSTSEDDSSEASTDASSTAAETDTL